MTGFREIYVAELKAAGFSAPDAGEIAAWYLGSPGAIPFPAHCRRVALAADCRAKDPAHCPVHGTPKYKAAPPQIVAKFKAELPKDITPEEFDAILTAGFDDTDGAGNKVKFGTLLRDHINDGSRSEQDRDARKRQLGVAVKMVRQAKPIATGTEGKPAERIYAGIVDGNAYIAVADEHNEIGALEMVSYRRGKRKEVRNA